MRMGGLNTLLFLMAVSPAYAQNDTDLQERRTVAHELYAAEDHSKITDALIKSLAENYVDRLAQLHPEITKMQLDDLRVRIESNLTDTKQDYDTKEEELLAQRLELQDLRAALDFYKSSAGQRLAEAVPALIPDAGRNQVDWASAAIKKATGDMNAAAKAPK
jgi:hypothetical protein